MPRVYNRSDLQTGLQSASDTLRSYAGISRAYQVGRHAEEQMDWLRRERAVQLGKERADLESWLFQNENLKKNGATAISDIAGGRAAPGEPGPGVDLDEFRTIYDATEGMPEADRAYALSYLKQRGSREIASRRLQESIFDINQAVEDQVIAPETGQQMIADLEDENRPDVTPDALIDAVRNERNGLAKAQAAFDVGQRTLQGMDQMIFGPEMEQVRRFFGIGDYEWQKRQTEAATLMGLYGQHFRKMNAQEAAAEVRSVLLSDVRDEDALWQKAAAQAAKDEGWMQAEDETRRDVNSRRRELVREHYGYLTGEGLRFDPTRPDDIWGEVRSRMSGPEVGPQQEQLPEAPSDYGDQWKYLAAQKRSGPTVYSGADKDPDTRWSWKFETKPAEEWVKEHPRQMEMMRGVLEQGGDGTTLYHILKMEGIDPLSVPKEVFESLLPGWQERGDAEPLSVPSRGTDVWKRF